MTPQDFRFLHRLRVRWCEVDMQKIVFNANYLMYLDTAFADYWRALALPYESSMHQLGGDLYVKKSSIEYHGSARYDDTLDVALKCARLGTSSMSFVGAVFRGDKCLVSGELIYVFADPHSQTSRAIPTALRELLLGYEAGQAMTQLRCGTWTELGADAARLRTDVFVQEQKIPQEMEWDEADATAVHAVAYNRLGVAVATGRLLAHSPGVARIGRMATERVLRGAGLGRSLIVALAEVARQRGDHRVVLHAQRSAQAFYTKLGFEVCGEPFEEAGIAHIEMCADVERLR